MPKENEQSRLPGTRAEKKRLLAITCFCVTAAVVAAEGYEYWKKCERHRLEEDNPEEFNRWRFARWLRKKKRITEGVILERDHPAFD
jgi:hypothetical protein